MPRGGRREGSGRKKNILDENLISILEKELIIPAIVHLKMAEDGVIAVSKTDIKRVYGQLGFQFWIDKFLQVHLGGREVVNGMTLTLWKLKSKFNLDDIQLTESFARKIIDDGLPSYAMRKRLGDIESNSTRLKILKLKEAFKITSTD